MSFHNLFLMRPKPIDGESLSSWRQRSAWRNGYTLFPVHSLRLRRVDPDVGLHETELTWLANTHNLEVQSLRPMTLVGKLGLINHDVGPHSQPEWWLRGRVAGAKKKTGPMYCPVCLLEDKEPFFRLHWRFGFLASCSAHGTELLDHCPFCSEPVWPGGAGIPSKLSPRFTSFRNCWACGCDLSSIHSGTVNADLERALLRGLQLGVVKVGAFDFPVIEVLQAIRGICQLFLRNRTRALILKSDSNYKQVFDFLSPGSEDNRTVEFMGVIDRRHLLPISWEILSDWPQSFRKFCADCGLLKWHFDGASHFNPNWMNIEIEDRLSKQNRAITKESLIQTFTELRNSLGRTPPKRELQRALSWRGSKNIDALYARRVAANQIEMQQLFANAEYEMLRNADRRQSLFHAAIDIAAIVLCMLKRAHLEEFCLLNAAELEERLVFAAENANPISAPVIEHIRNILRTYPIARKRAYSPKLRQVKKRFSMLVQAFPEDLIKSVSTYWLTA